MAEHDDDTPASSDPDRAAILARRQRFVALALSGLATTVATSGACTDGKSDDVDPKADSKTDRKRSVDETPPGPCLSVAIPPEPPSDRPPKACLKISDPSTSTDGGSSDSGTSETGDETESPSPRPQACLSKAAPQPCLRKAPPKPCLKVAPPNDDNGEL